MTPSPLRLRLLNDYAIVVAGLRAMLEPYSHRVSIVEEDVRDSASRRVDITLFDTFGAQADRHGIDRVLADPDAGAVVLYSWDTRQGLVSSALQKGCRGYLGKTIPASELVEALEAVAAGETVTRHCEESADDASAASPEGAWPGRDEGLTAREAEVVALIVRGLTNAEIAARSYITINSLKSCIRAAYRKMGVERRSQAVRWGIEHGMLPPADDGRT